MFAAVSSHYPRQKSKTYEGDDQSIVPLLHKTQSGRVEQLETFSHYVARQLGMEANECPKLCKLAYDYLRKSNGCEQNIFEFFGIEEAEAKSSLYVKLIEEFDRCILSYFAFHWTHVSLMITQVLSVEYSEKKAPKLKAFVMAATRQQRFEKITKELKVTRIFSTLVEELKAIRCNGKSNCNGIMVPVALSERSPVLLLMGGGMGAGKSTVLKDLMKGSFWSEAAKKAVVVEADAFKETDVVYKALNATGYHDDKLQTAEWVHKSSTNAASSLLVTALNEGRDVILDSTLSWEPFVEQTIAMARNVHKCRYRMGTGYKVNEDGSVTEKYWEQVNEDEEKQVDSRKPYRIELVGVVCDAYLAVIRGIRRAIMVGRAVRVNSQLKSHKRFATAFPKYCELVDNAKLFNTNNVSYSPKLIAWKDREHKLLVDPNGIKCLTRVSEVNIEAESIFQLYTDSSQLFVWKDIVLSPSRPILQKELKIVIQKIEKD